MTARGKKNGKLRVLVVGIGNMGVAHARAYDEIDGFELAGLCARRIAKRNDLPERWSNVPRFADYDDALETRSPTSSRSTLCRTRMPTMPSQALEAGAHVFVEKPLAETVGCRARGRAPRRRSEKLVIGYILRQHPSWTKFVEIARQLGTATGVPHEPQPAVQRRDLGPGTSV